MKLPRSVQEIADVIGRERALYLVGQLPRCIVGNARDNGRSPRVIMYVPKRMTLDHALVRILGLVDAEKLSEAFGGEILCPAPCLDLVRLHRDKGIRRLSAEGVRTSMIADWFGMSARHVTNILQGVDLVVEIPQEERKAANDESPIQRNLESANGQKRSHRGGK